MTEQPSDLSDQDGSFDGEMIAALKKTDEAIKTYIRQKIGDDEYEAYVSRNQLDGGIDKTIGDKIGAAFTRPIDEAEGQAATLATQLIQEGEDEEEARRHAALDALRAALSKLQNPADKAYNVAYFEAVDELSDRIIEALFLKYPDIQVAEIDRALFSVMLSQRSDGSGSHITLYLSLAIEGTRVSTEVFYTVIPEDPFVNKGRPERIDVDPADFDGVVAGVDIALLKKDALEALQSAVRSAL